MRITTARAAVRSTLPSAVFELPLARVPSFAPVPSLAVEPPTLAVPAAVGVASESALTARLVAVIGEPVLSTKALVFSSTVTTAMPAPLLAGVASPFEVTVTWFAALRVRTPVTASVAVPVTLVVELLVTMIVATAASCLPPSPSLLPAEPGALVPCTSEVEARLTPAAPVMLAEPWTLTVAIEPRYIRST